MPPTTKKDMILDTAMSLMAREGMPDFSLKKIASEIGCSEALIYRYYPSKKDLVRACMNRTTELDMVLFGEVIPKSVEGITDIPERIKAISDTYLRYHIEHWSETLAFEQLRKLIMFEKLEKDYEEFQYKVMAMSAEAMGIQPYYNELGEIVPFFAWWALVVQTTVFFIRKIRDGILPDDQHTCDIFFDILYHGSMSPAEGF